MNDTAELLQRWSEHGAEDAFAQIVTRHIDLVYSVAVRKTSGDTGLAADVTQTVFADLARKARSLRTEGSLAGWLHRHTCFVAATAVRGELRRRSRERTAAAMHSIESHPESDWTRVAPLLDDAVNALDDADRRAILLRFYEHRDLRAVGEFMGVSDDAAQKRVSRALEKLRTWLGRRGITSTTAALAALLGANSVTAAPAGLASAVASIAVTTAAATTTGAMAWTVLEIMTHVKTKLAIAAAVTTAIVAPVIWQENAIAKIRSENRALAAPDSSTTPQPHDAFTSVDDAATQATRDRAELDRLRAEIASLRAQVQQAVAARPTVVRPQPTPTAASRPGYVSLAEARDVGAASGAALFQTIMWAMKTGDTNRVIELADWSEEGARDQMADMVRDSGRARADIEAGKALDITFRVIREVPLDDGDVALVMEMTEDGNAHREAMRIRRAGAEWHLVVGKNGPKDVKLSDELMRD